MLFYPDSIFLKRVLSETLVDGYVLGNYQNGVRVIEKSSLDFFTHIIEDKINRFAERDRHQLFVEPEGWNTIEIYVNGFSSSLPEHIQLQALRLVPGFENCKMFRPGYAIEYDYFPPTQLKYSLETKQLKTCFLLARLMVQRAMRKQPARD